MITKTIILALALLSASPATAVFASGIHGNMRQTSVNSSEKPKESIALVGGYVWSSAGIRNYTCRGCFGDSGDK